MALHMRIFCRAECSKSEQLRGRSHTSFKSRTARWQPMRDAFARFAVGPISIRLLRINPCVLRSTYCGGNLIPRIDRKCFSQYLMSYQ